MIVRGGLETRGYAEHDIDVFVYGLGFETRSTSVISALKRPKDIFALKMPEKLVHSYQQNLLYAAERNHTVLQDHKQLFKGLKLVVGQRHGQPLRFGFDISSVNRIMMLDVLKFFAQLVRPNDTVTLFYSPAAYQEPSMQFPQIERLGPVNGLFSGFNADPTRPLCLILGAGFEPGTSMGIIGQLEPKIAICFWGSGVDARFDRAVRKANFNFEFPDIATRSVRYKITDPLGSYFLLENAVYGLSKSHNVIIVPLGPKIFTCLAALTAMVHFGDVAIWRVQQSIVDPADAQPSGKFVFAELETSALIKFSSDLRSAFGEL